MELQIESKARLPKQFIYSFDHTEINKVMIIIWYRYKNENKNINLKQVQTSQNYRLNDVFQKLCQFTLDVNCYTELSRQINF